MTREKVRELLPIIQAYSEGKTIQYRVSPPFLRIDKRDTSYLKEWIDLDEDRCDGFSCDETINYRVKPEPKCRPFKTREECWNEMSKHFPFGWIKSNSNDLYSIASINCEGITTFAYYRFLESFEKFTFIDGTPFGIKEE